MGSLSVPLSILESDDETDTMRSTLLDEFAGKFEDETAPHRRGFLTALDSARAADWKLEHIEVYAWTRNGDIKAGKVLGSQVDRWIEGGKTAAFPLNAGDLKPTGVTTDELLVAEMGAATPTEPTTPTTPTIPTTPTPPASGDVSALLSGLIGNWQTNSRTARF